ncbi:MAG: 4-(cytidine 5'-diphospho)-2-C-methyl-D-erythritol kinase [Hyphomonas sp.]
MTETAPAKVNLFLHVGPAKANGRHDLDSLVVFADGAAADRLSVTALETLGLEINGPRATQTGAIADNLVLKAARALQAASGSRDGAFFRLNKMLPVAAGIGGGSSDAAAALRLLTRLWEIDPAHAVAVAPGLGGDVPVALLGEAAMMRGEGERVSPVRLPGRLPALLANTGLACPTGPVFAGFDAAGSGKDFVETGDIPAFQSLDELTDWLAVQRNDLEAPAIRLVPEIGDLMGWLQAQPGARLVRMSGSGATCFALFAEMDAARRAEAAFRQDWRGGWAAACSLGGGK